MSETIGTTFDVPAPKAAAPPGELVLRIRGGDYHGRVVRIRASQCTVGSAPDCTLRLSAPGLRPLHCIILRGEAGATVRRWSPDTQLNGRAFSDALLMAGDRLGIGPIELEVLEESEFTQQRRPEGAATASHPVGELAGEIVSQLRQDLRRNEDARKRKVERQRLRQSRHRIKSLEAELERLQAGVSSIAANEGLPAPQVRLEAAETQLQSERAAWESERQLLLGKLQEKDEQVQRLEGAVDELRKAVSQDKERYEEAARQSELHRQAEAAANTSVRELQDRIAALDAAAAGSQNPGETSEALESAQRQVHELFAEGERLREELHQAICSLAAAQCRLTEQEAALTAFRELHQHAVAELELQCKTLQTQLTDAQTKFDEQSGRVAELEGQLTAFAAPEQNHRIAELESQLRVQSEELHVARVAKGELQNAAAQSSVEWSQRESELTQRIECLERLAGNLEDELRSAAANPDKIQSAEEQRRNLEQQLSTAQRQWSEQRLVLEEQAMSAHQQIQDMENQVASVREALHSAHSQVRERDQLLSQIREEVRQQLALWQQERVQLLEQLAVGQDRGHSESEPCRTQPDGGQQQRLAVVERTVDESLDDGYSDRQLPAGENAMVETDEISAFVGFRDVDDTFVSNGDSGGNELARVEATSLWRNQYDASADQCDKDENLQMDEAQQADRAAAALPAATECVERWPEPPSSRAGSGSDEEESIENYMTRLLKRVRGDAVANTFVTQQAVQTAPEIPCPETNDQIPSLAQRAAIETTEFLPRKSAPEQAVDVAAMRELAVSTTRQAINRSRQQRYRKTALGTTLAACAAIALSVTLFAWGVDTGNWIAWTGSGLTLAAGAAFMMRRFRMLGSARPA